MGRAAIRLEEAQSFDRVADAYDRLGDLSENELIGSWLEGLLPATGGRVLDLGCGTGRHAVRLARRFEQVDAIDLSEPMIDLAKRRRPRPNVTYRLADLRDIAGAGRYDFVLIRRGPVTAWEIYRLSTRREWLDHLVTDRFFSLEELERSCQALFPGYRFDILGGPRRIGLVWDAPHS
jgi:SAM-dependent methyltransferase